MDIEGDPRSPHSGAGAAALVGYQPSPDHAMRLLAAAVRQDLAEIRALSAEAGIDPGAMTSIAPLVAFPLLQSCGRLLEGSMPRFWPHGYCPICAAWPILVSAAGSPDPPAAVRPL